MVGGDLCFLRNVHTMLLLACRQNEVNARPGTAGFSGRLVFIGAHAYLAVAAMGTAVCPAVSTLTSTKNFNEINLKKTWSISG
jgi:hypothetical protein